jgi:hypothetical protein
MGNDRSPLADDDELLFRQVHPSFVRNGRPSSQAFRPMPKGEGKREQGLPAFSDPLTAPPEKVADPAHAVIDFTAHPRSRSPTRSRLSRCRSALR